MSPGKNILYVLFVVFVIQAGFSTGKKFCSIFLFLRLFYWYNEGFPLKAGDLQVLLMNALKVGDCARVVPVSDPIPLRFRRATNRKKFQCIITLN